MGYPTPIEWTDATWNPIGGCSVKSPGCKPCYAMQLAGTRLHKLPLYAGTTTRESGRPVFNGKMTEAPLAHPVWSWPVRWGGATKQRKLGGGKPSLIFVGDMADLYHENRPRSAIERTLAGIIYTRHIGQLLTKRPELMAEHFEELHRTGRWYELEHPLYDEPNFAPEATWQHCVVRRFWPGTSAERQREFDLRWRHLRRIADLGFTIFISYEPALGPLHLPADFLALGRRAQVIAGGVSGNWPFAPDPDWFRHVRDQCAGAGVPFFFKQWGEWAPDPLDSIKCGGPRFKKMGSTWMMRAGKRDAGRLLDGREHNEFPVAA